jgi:SET domain-containing protein
MDSKIEIKNIRGFKGVFAKEEVAANSILIKLKGVLSSNPTKYSIQLGKDTHLNLPGDKKNIQDPDLYWIYLNHGCEPNGYINTEDNTFRALRDIQKGEELRFNYFTTEYEFASPFYANADL